MDKTKVDGSILMGEDVLPTDQVYGTTVFIAQNYQELTNLDNKVSYLKFGICSGVVIGPRHILTAAHCAKNYTNSRVIMSANGNIATDADSIYTIIKSTIPYAYAHYKKKEVELQQATDTKPDPKDKSNYYDIAVLELDRRILQSRWDADYFKTKSTQDHFKKNSTLTELPAVITGYGRTSDKIYHIASDDNKALNGVIQKGNLTLPRSTATQKIFHFSQRGTVGVCLGDSGGPMFVMRNGKIYLQAIAIAVHKKESLSPDSDFIHNQCYGDAYYLNVDIYKDWIRARVSN